MGRDPLDVCVSIHFSPFAGEMPFPPDLGGLGRYWRSYEKLMADWRRAPPADAFHEVCYARLVADFEGETRRLPSFRGLRFDPRCLAFHEMRRSVTTASLAQMRQPLYLRRALECGHFPDSVARSASEGGDDGETRQIRARRLSHRANPLSS